MGTEVPAPSAAPSGGVPQLTALEGGNMLYAKTQERKKTLRRVRIVASRFVRHLNDYSGIMKPSTEAKIPLICGP